MRQQRDLMTRASSSPGLCSQVSYLLTACFGTKSLKKKKNNKPLCASVSLSEIWGYTLPLQGAGSRRRQAYHTHTDAGGSICFPRPFPVLMVS